MGRIAGWALLGLALGGALAFGLGLVWLTFVNTDNREGAAAMAVMFFGVPLGGVLGAIAGAVAGARRR